MAHKIVAANRELIAADKAAKAAEEAEEAAKASEAASGTAAASEAAGTATATISKSGIASALVSTAGNVISSALETLVSTIPAVGGIAAKITKTVKKETDRIDSRIQNITKMMPRVGGGGGAARKKSNTKKKIKKTTKRINYLLSRFKGRRKKINYTKRLHR
jgi:hypothetical protein